MEDARGRAALAGKLEQLEELYRPCYAYLKEGDVQALWEDILIGEKDTIPEFTSWRNKASVRLVPRAVRRLLEIGPGLGHAIPQLYARCRDLEYYGADLSAKSIDKLSSEYPGTFAVADIEHLPWDGSQFDAILMLEVLEHIEAPRTFRVLSALRERLSHEGVVVLSVPLREDLRRSYFVCPHCGQYVHQIGHLRSYTPALLRAELRVSGFTVEKWLPMAGGTYFGVRRQFLTPFFPDRIQPMVMIVRCRVDAGTAAPRLGDSL